MKEKTISEEALAILSECTQDGQIVRINSGQLTRPMYKEVNSVLVAIGGKWSRSAKGHVFEEPANEISDMLEGCIVTGLAIPLRPSGYFKTPRAVAEHMCDLAGIHKDMKVLEPSGGSGDLANVIATRKPCTLIIIEKDFKLIRVLEEKFWRHPKVDRPPYIQIIEGDFFDHNEKYDAIVMNPPFIRLSEIDHIMHAWDCLTFSGKVVSVASSSITFRREKKAVVFREFLNQNGRIEELPEGSFKDSGTMVKSVLVVLEKRRSKG